MDRRRFIKASIAGIGMFSGALALGCVPGASAGSSTPQSPTESGGAVATASSLGIGGSSPADSQTAPLLSENRASATPTVKLNSGFVMPLLGIGTWTLSDSVAEESVYCALQNGYRLIDTAQYYGNEAGVGRAVRRAAGEGIAAREDVFVTTKVSPPGYADPATAVQERLSKLGLDYIDLLLIHQPGSNDESVYRAMEQSVRDGKVRSIGISNYYTRGQLDGVLAYAEIPPAVIQNENHPYNQNTDLASYYNVQ